MPLWDTGCTLGDTAGSTQANGRNHRAWEDSGITLIRSIESRFSPNLLGRGQTGDWQNLLCSVRDMSVVRGGVEDAESPTVYAALDEEWERGGCISILRGR